MTSWIKGWASGRICRARGVHEYFWLLLSIFQPHIRLQAHVWTHENYGFKGTGGHDGHTYTHAHTGERHNVCSLLYVAYKFVNISFFSRGDSAVHSSFPDSKLGPVRLLALCSTKSRGEADNRRVSYPANGESLQRLKVSTEPTLGTDNSWSL